MQKLESLKSIDQAIVLKKGIPAASLVRTTQGAILHYFPDYLLNEHYPDISYHLPKRKEPYETFGTNLHPYFAGLLPEGLRLRVLSLKLKTSEDDLLSLLMAAGLDTIGDTAIQPVLSDSNNQDFFRTTNAFHPKNCFQVDIYDMIASTLSIQKNDLFLHSIRYPGVQNKVSSEMISFHLQGLEGQKSKVKKRDYIVKINPENKPDLVQNEYYFMQLASRIGICAAKTSLHYDLNKRPVLFVERFDRIFDHEAKELTWIHQEDACQFLNKYPSEKYRIGIKEIASGLREWCRSPIVETASLIRLLAYCYLIGNGDLHAKNISLQHDQNGAAVALSPAYDLLSTYVYGDPRMALKFMGRDDNFTRKDFLEFGRIFHVNSKVVNKILDELCDQIIGLTDDIETIGFDKNQTTRLKNLISKRRDDLS